MGSVRLKSPRIGPDIAPGAGLPQKLAQSCGRPAPGPMFFTPSPLRGRGGGGGEQRTVAKADAYSHRDDLVMETTP